jgi:N-acetylglucosaminyldiphosphoundecaprenol N-acetyl-beta-D-mannosaminyltransferase
MPNMYERSRIISLHVHHLSFRESIDQVSAWGLQHRHAFVCFANVHMVIEAHNDPSFQKVLDEATLVLPDGKPVAMSCRWLHKRKQERIPGMDFMPALLQKAHELKARIFLYGSTDEVLKKIEQRMQADFPQAVFAGAISPPFRPLTDEEIKAHISRINESGAHFVLVALGCPKQEKWMAVNYKEINAVLLGLGGAFPVFAGLQKRAPVWMRRSALEWLYRLIQEPGRLFKRYFYTNSYFMTLLMKQLMTRPKNKAPESE